jgi:alkylation response protein AidB-like acyl-CoA dehydrogenase
MAAPHPDPVAAAEALAAELTEQAARLEGDGVTRADVDRLAAAGLLAVFAPPELGGVPAAAQRRVAELLAGSSPDAWFVWFQHGPVVKMLAAGDNHALADRHLGPLARGEQLGGVAWSHLRTARPSVFAERVDGGWSFSGFQPWCTGWGLVDVVLTGALDRERDRVVFGLVPAGDRPQLHSAGLLGLAAMGGTSTHALRLDGLVVPDDDVVLVADREPWAAVDAAANANVQPSTFGVALAALDGLRERAPDVAATLRARVCELRTQAYRLMDEAAKPEAIDERLALRAQALVLAIECCTALLAARGGQGMGLGDPAQRLLRAAAFQLVHSQAAHVRAATLDVLRAEDARGAP